MKLKNSLKLVVTNFGLFWKLLIYKIVVLLLVFLLLLPILSKIDVALTQSGFFDELAKIFNGVALRGVATFVTSTCGIISSFFVACSMLIEMGFVIFLYFVFIVFIVAPFLLHLSDVPTSECLYSYMTSLNKFSFIVNFTDKLKMSVGYSILKTIIELPFFAILICVSYNIGVLVNINSVLTILAPFLWTIFVVFMLVLKSALESGWAQGIVCFNVCAFKGLKRGFKSVSRNYLGVMSSFAVIVVVSLGITLIFGAYALVIILPFITLISCIFGQVLFFESQGMNYYIAPEEIIKPRKLEQADSNRRVKFII